MASLWRSKKPRQHKSRQTTAPVAPARGKNSTGRSSRRKLWFRLGTVGLVLVLVWGIPELIVRWANPRLEVYRAIMFANDPNSPELFMKDRQLHWKLRPNVSTRFCQASVRTSHHGFRGSDPVPGRRVVLCLGD